MESVLNAELDSKKALPVRTTKAVTETPVSASIMIVLKKTSERTFVKGNTVKTKTVSNADKTLTVDLTKSAEMTDNATAETNFALPIKTPQETSAALKIKTENVLNAELVKLKIASHSKAAIPITNVPVFLANALSTLLVQLTKKDQLMKVAHESLPAKKIQTVDPPNNAQELRPITFSISMITYVSAMLQNAKNSITCTKMTPELNYQYNLDAKILIPKTLQLLICVSVISLMNAIITAQQVLLA